MKKLIILILSIIGSCNQPALAQNVFGTGTFTALYYTPDGALITYHPSPLQDSLTKYTDLSDLYSGHNDTLHIAFIDQAIIYRLKVDSLAKIEENKAWVRRRDELSKKYNMKLK